MILSHNVVGFLKLLGDQPTPGGHSETHNAWNMLTRVLCHMERTNVCYYTLWHTLCLLSI